MLTLDRIAQKNSPEIKMLKKNAAINKMSIKSL